MLRIQYDHGISGGILKYSVLLDISRIDKPISGRRLFPTLLHKPHRVMFNDRNFQHLPECISPNRSDIS